MQEGASLLCLKAKCSKRINSHKSPFREVFLYHVESDSCLLRGEVGTGMRNYINRTFSHKLYLPYISPIYFTIISHHLLSLETLMHLTSSDAIPITSWSYIFCRISCMYMNILYLLSCSSVFSPFNS